MGTHKFHAIVCLAVFLPSISCSRSGSEGEGSEGHASTPIERGRCAEASERLGFEPCFELVNEEAWAGVRVPIDRSGDRYAARVCQANCGSGTASDRQSSFKV